MFEISSLRDWIISEKRAKALFSFFVTLYEHVLICCCRVSLAVIVPQLSEVFRSLKCLGRNRSFRTSRLMCPVLSEWGMDTCGEDSRGRSFFQYRIESGWG